MGGWNPKKPQPIGRGMGWGVKEARRHPAEEKGATVVDQRDDGSSGLLGDQDKSDLGDVGWC